MARKLKDLTLGDEVYTSSEMNNMFTSKTSYTSDKHTHDKTLKDALEPIFGGNPDSSESRLDNLTFRQILGDLKPIWDMVKDTPDANA